MNGGFDVWLPALGWMALHAFGVALLTRAAVAAGENGGVRRFARSVAIVSLGAGAMVVAAYADEGLPIVTAYVVAVAALAAIHGGLLGVLVLAGARPAIVVTASAAMFIVAVPLSFVVQLMSICTIAGCA